MPQGQVKNQAQRTQPSKQVPGTHPPFPPERRVATMCHPGTLTSGAPLTSSTSTTGAPAPPGLLTPRPPPPTPLNTSWSAVAPPSPTPCKASPPPPSGSAPSTLTLPGPELCPYLDSASPQSVRRTSTHRICILESPHDSPDIEGVTSLGRAPSPLPILIAQGPRGPRQGRGLQERLRKAPDTQWTVLSTAVLYQTHRSLPWGGNPPTFPPPHLSHPQNKAK